MMNFVSTLLANSQTQYLMAVMGLYFMAAVAVFGLYRCFLRPMVRDLVHVVRGIQQGTIRRKAVVK